MKVLPLDTLGDKAEMLGYYTASFLINALPFIVIILIGYFAYKFFKKKKLHRDSR